MQEREIFTQEERKSLNNYCANEIYQYGIKYFELERILDSYGYRVPVECWHNFRDSWFHYRKLYKSKERVSVLNEQYAMEEHLLRAWKDAIIFLLQEISASLEFWYLIGINPVAMPCSVQSEAFEIASQVHTKMKCLEEGVTHKNWVKVIVDGYKETDEAIRFCSCYYYYKEFILSDTMNHTLQKILHNLKDLVLQIRYSGANISRSNDTFGYMQNLLNLLKEINDRLEDSGVLYLISAAVKVSRCIEELREDVC